MNSEKLSSRAWSRSVALFARRHLSTVAVCLLLASGCAATTPREYVSEEELHAIVVQHNLSAISTGCFAGASRRPEATSRRPVAERSARSSASATPSTEAVLRTTSPAAHRRRTKK